ncbi:hypothetical protein [Salisaeta longa]|uniref:hypothetical protein n=1 Tax=Salisaeta longa TaxID=503170 RepID=UPI0012F81BB2|nr:hypothetical protein [Salisaeta longa]
MQFRSTNAMVVLPKGRQLGLYRWISNDLAYLAPLDADVDAIVHIDQERSVISALTQAGKKVKTWTLAGEKLEPVRSGPHLPKGCRGHCVNVIGSQVYVGGRAKNDKRALLWRCTLGTPHASWTQVAVPPPVCKSGKTVDALFRDGNRLLAVDDLILPKWILIYDARDPTKPNFQKAEKLRFHTTYEQTFCAAANSRWMALGSKGVNHGNVGYFLSLLDKKTLKERYLWRSSAKREDDKTPPLHDVSFGADRLFVAGGSRGVGVVELSGRSRDKSAGGKEPATLATLKYWKPASGAPVVGVKTVAGYNGCFAIVAEDDDTRQWEKVDG